MNTPTLNPCEECQGTGETIIEKHNCDCPDCLGTGLEQPQSRIMQLERELAEAQNILKQCLSIMPVGYIPTHTVKNLPKMVGDLAKALAEETTECEQLERELAAKTVEFDRLNESLDKNKRLFTNALADKIIESQLKRIKQLEDDLSLANQTMHKMKKEYP